jgi:hypothetical protein
MPRIRRAYRSDVNDPGCVKTHVSVKCEKYNSPGRIKPLCAQHGLTLMMRNSSEIFYARGGHLSFHTASTLSGHCGCGAAPASPPSRT